MDVHGRDRTGRVKPPASWTREVQAERGGIGHGKVGEGQARQDNTGRANSRRGPT